MKFAGRDENAVREKAKKIVADLKAGLDFVKAVVENSDGQDLEKSKGSLGNTTMKDLDERFAPYAKAIKGLKAGGVSEPFEDEIGVHILRVDERTEASSESVFDESAVRMDLMKTKLPDAQKSFLAGLRENSYIKINETYRPLVNPILFADERKVKPGN